MLPDKIVHFVNGVQLDGHQYADYLKLEAYRQAYDAGVAKERKRCLEIYNRYKDTLPPVEIRRMMQDGDVPIGLF